MTVSVLCILCRQENTNSHNVLSILERAIQMSPDDTSNIHSWWFVKPRGHFTSADIRLRHLVMIIDNISTFCHLRGWGEGALPLMSHVEVEAAEEESGSRSLARACFPKQLLPPTRHPLDRHAAF